MENDQKKTSPSPVIIVVILLIVLGGVFLLKNIWSKNNSKAITQEEVSKHATKEDCWMVIEGKVYDVTKFIPKHPGKDAIVMGCGKDATEIFNTRPNDGTSHSNRARGMLSGLQIGILPK